MRREFVRRSRLGIVTDWEARAERVRYRVSPLADDCGVTPRHLRRFLRLKFGKSPLQWMAEKRLARAAALLQQASLVKQAAAEAGFKNPAHFSRRFTQLYGVPPSAFGLATPRE
jgi:transcriptional regulator GlxA family with amidase domain